MSETARKRLGIVKYLKEVKAELKKVMWPTKKQMVNHTLTVIAAIFIVAVFIGIIDYGFNTGLNALLYFIEYM